MTLSTTILKGFIQSVLLRIYKPIISRSWREQSYSYEGRVKSNQIYRV